MSEGKDAALLQAERERYVTAFNRTMIKIWCEQQILLDTVRTGALYRSTIAIGMTAEEKFTSVTLSQSFNTYGLFVDWGTGRDTPRGNPGDLGHNKNRRRKRWFSRKYYASVMNLQEFFADNLGQESCSLISAALSRKALQAAITK